jgi:serine/threonine protein kinase
LGLSKLIHDTSARDVISSAHESSGIIVRRAELAADNGLGTSPKAQWTDPLTAGVGTASYAAPEQVASRKYGTKADIFSLGLLLLELLCCFSTEHERVLTFQDCRHRRVVPKELEAFPVAAQTILRCTDPDARVRPTAQELFGIDITRRSDRRLPIGLSQEDVHPPAVRLQLSQKDDTIARLQKELVAKQLTIDSLCKEVDRLNQVVLLQRDAGVDLTLPQASSVVDPDESSSSSSNSSDDDEL